MTKRATESSPGDRNPAPNRRPRTERGTDMLWRRASQRFETATKEQVQDFAREILHELWKKDPASAMKVNETFCTRMDVAKKEDCWFFTSDDNKYTGELILEKDMDIRHCIFEIYDKCVLDELYLRTSKTADSLVYVQEDEGDIVHDFEAELTIEYDTNDDVIKGEIDFEQIRGLENNPSFTEKFHFTARRLETDPDRPW
jgi:hypothetical protein